jgi:MmyB-like transcription regulator ligand binding domain
MSDLIGELSRRSEEFRTLWAAHDVKYYRSGIQPFHHPVVEDLTLNYNALELPADTGQTMIVYTAEPGSPSGEALKLLASWTHARPGDRRPRRPRRLSRAPPHKTMPLGLWPGCRE